MPTPPLCHTSSVGAKGGVRCDAGDPSKAGDTCGCSEGMELVVREPPELTFYRPHVSVIASPLMTVSHYSDSNLPREKENGVRL